MKELASSAGVWVSTMRAIAFQRASTVRLAALRSSALSLAKAFSIGWKSGSYRGRKRRLAQSGQVPMVSNCVWKVGEVVATLRQPFDRPTHTATAAARIEAGESAKFARSEIWLGKANWDPTFSALGDRRLRTGVCGGLRDSRAQAATSPANDDTYAAPSCSCGSSPEPDGLAIDVELIKFATIS